MTDEPSPITVPAGIPAIEAATEGPRRTAPQLLIITGMSGAGRTRAAAVLEDLDWYVVDNLPAQMLTILFLDASDEVLVRRYEQVRRPHPLQGDGTILDGITTERAVLGDMRERSDTVIDTSDLNVHDLARQVREVVAGATPDVLRVSVMSFGFKYGIPLDADHVADVRFLANPYWITELRHLSGRDAPVRDYVLGLPGALTFVDRYVDALEPVLAGYLHEEKRYVTIAVGCTGGKHRSVAISEAVAARLRERGHQVAVTARDLGKE